MSGLLSSALITQASFLWLLKLSLGKALEKISQAMFWYIIINVVSN